jgi:hypothetical protein
MSMSAECPADLDVGRIILSESPTRNLIKKCVRKIFVFKTVVFY